MPQQADTAAVERIAAIVDDVLDDLKAESIVRLDVRHLTSVTDIMYIATGRSSRHVRAVAEELIERCKAQRIRPLGVEGEAAGEWVLIDLADVVVHIMLPKVRAFYELEKLWDLEDIGETGRTS